MEKMNAIQEVFKAMESEFQTYEDETKHIPLLKSAYTHDKPLMTLDHMSNLTNAVLVYTEQVNELFSGETHDQHFIATTLDQISQEVIKIQSQVDRFQPAQILQQCLMELNLQLTNVKAFIHNTQQQQFLS